MKHYGLLGKSLGYSFSKSFFESFFEKNAIEAEFSNIEIPAINQVIDVLKSNLSGLCVTIPYKETILPFLDELSQEASEIGAANVVQFHEEKRIGHNSDAFGFHQSIKPFLTNQHERALIIGTGGASKAVAYVLKRIGIDVFFISRNPNGVYQYGYSDINEHMVKSCKLIVHTTPIGTFPNTNESIDFPFQFLTSDHLVVDLVYNPPLSKFLLNSKDMGAVTLNGHSMLEQQALKAWEIWNS
jgi:shikimate dehydrogenase